MMAQRNDEARQAVYDLWLSDTTFNRTDAARDIGINLRTVFNYIKEFETSHPPEIQHATPVTNAREPERIPDCKNCLEKERLERAVKELQSELSNYRSEKLTNEDVKEYIIGLSNEKIPVPRWSIDPNRNKSTVIPSLMISDTHCAEVVYPDQVFGVNKYNMEICGERMQRLCENTIELLSTHINADYPGICICLNGDLVSGDIHDELSITNDAPIMPAVLHMLGLLETFLQTMLDNFDSVMVKATAGGNHSRTTKKIPSKNKAYTNFDWLIYQFLRKHFESVNENRIHFDISDGDDIQFDLFNHRYRMTHGDQFRGGQGFVGPFAPITRNDKKKRSAADTYGMGYDTLLIGHFHTLMFLPKVIVNSSVIGYSEYAINNNFEYEPAQQALWLTHKDRGITGRYPVFCDSI